MAAPPVACSQPGAPHPRPLGPAPSPGAQGGGDSEMRVPEAGGREVAPRGGQRPSGSRAEEPGGAGHLATKPSVDPWHAMGEGPPQASPRTQCSGSRADADAHWAGATYSGDDSGVRLDISSGVGTVHTERTGRGMVTAAPFPHQGPPALWGHQRAQVSPQFLTTSQEPRVPGAVLASTAEIRL